MWFSLAPLGTVMAKVILPLVRTSSTGVTLRFTLIFSGTTSKMEVKSYVAGDKIFDMNNGILKETKPKLKKKLRLGGFLKLVSYK